MYLKNLDIQGFKSFADRIKLDFHDGITAVVGPNGSGKSNISDAIRWVLGEQSAKNLRGSKMEDVIFAGTEHRRAVGYAEVNLTIDNNDRELPIDYNEVTISRRVYRSGESEYLINNTHCRLKDIYELFLDTGVGRDGYSIIGQGQIDSILSTKSEDRRVIFEEASGIMKYKVRKIEAERKLEHTSQNLQRINDIIFELESHLEPLYEQSETAKKFLALRDELRGVEVSLFIHNIDSYNSKIEEIIKLIEQQKQEIQSEKLGLENITNKNQKNSEMNQHLDLEIQKNRELFHSLENQTERHASEIQIYEERIVNIKDNIVRLEAEIVDLTARLSQFDDDKQVRQKKLDYLNSQLNDFTSKLKEMEEKYQDMLVGLNDNEKHIETMDSQLTDTLDLLADKRYQAGNVNLQIEGIKKRQSDIKNEIFQNKLEIDKEKMLVEDLEESIYKSKNQLKEFNDSVQNILKEKEDIVSSLNKNDNEIERLNLQRQYKIPRLKMLKDMDAKMEGYSRSVKEILKASQSDSSFGRGINGPLAQLIEMDVQYETAIEMALGNKLQNIVTDNDSDAKRCIEYIKKHRFGRATFLPVSSVRARTFERTFIEKISRMEGFIGIASELVSCKDKYRQIIESLLGRTVVVDNFDNASSISRHFNNTVKIVTIDGEVFNPGGSISGGYSKTSDSGLISRYREIPELESEIAILDQNLAEKNAIKRELNKQLEEVEQERIANQSKYQEAELIVLRDENHLKHVNEIIERLNSKNEMLDAELQQLNNEVQNENEEATKFSEEISRLEGLAAEYRQKIGDLTSQHKKKTSEREVYYEDITNYKLSVNSIVESISNIKEVTQKLEDDAEHIKASIDKKQEEKNKCKYEIEKLNEKNKEIEGLINQAINEKNEIQANIVNISNKKKELEEEIYGTVQLLNKKNEKIQLLQVDIGKLDVKKAKLETELESIIDKLWNEYELTTLTAQAYRTEIKSIQGTQRKVNELKNNIRELGAININAIEDYIKTKERYEFMVKQRDDMEDAKGKLLKVISEMTAIMKKQFAEQFKLINHNFGQVFRELFNGGRAELKLADETNILECGIDIIVQPKGKKLQNMMLLSGGEKALTAISLLFAILKMRPTPFCILDEIEAALDEANVQRFGQYLRTFSDSTQFVVVTHRKGTMEMSDTLYGVTMEEHGVSKLVSLKLNERVNVN